MGRAMGAGSYKCLLWISEPDEQLENPTMRLVADFWVCVCVREFSICVYVCGTRENEMRWNKKWLR